MPHQTELPPHVGSVLGGRYELVRHIARGGMGDVYEGRDEVLDRRVAVKLFRAASPADRGRFDAEVRLLAGLDHHTLVRVYDAGPHGDDAYLVLELIDGPSLAKVLADRGPLPPAEVAVLGADLADALASIHERNVVHRDVTTSNVLCDPDGRARLVDFGIARLLGSPRVTATLTTVGTAAFMAPEQVVGDEVTPAADVYSLGLVLLELLTGARAFDGAAVEVAAARLVRDPDTTTGVPGSWRALLQAMTRRAPADRPTAAVVRDRLRAMTAAPEQDTAAMAAVPAELAATAAFPSTQVLGGSTELFTAPPFPVPVAAPVSDRRRVGAWAVAAMAAAVLIAAVFMSSRSGFDTPTKTTGSVPTEHGGNGAVRESDADPDPTTTVTTVATTIPTTMTAPTTTALVVPGPDFDPFAPPGHEKKAKKDEAG